MEYQLYIVENFFQQTNEGHLKDIVWSWLNMKREGYQSYHGQNILPVSSDDFFGIHAIICNKETGEPLLTFKIVPHSSCVRYNHVFPFWEICHGLYDAGEEILIREYVKEKTKNGRDISYSGGWTKKVDIEREVSKELNKIYTAIHYHIHKEFNLETFMAFGAVNQGTYGFFKKEWGIESLIERPINLHFYNKQPCKMINIETEDFSFNTKRLAQIYQSLWDNRISYREKKDDSAKVA